MIRRKLIEESPASMVSLLIKQRGCIFKNLELRNIHTEDFARPSIFGPSVAAPNGTGPAVVEILSSVVISHPTLRNLEALSLINVQLDERIMNGVSLIL